MRLYQLTITRLTEECNISKEVFLEALYKEDIIKEEAYEKAKDYCIVAHRKGFFGNLFNKVFTKEDGTIYSAVKVIK